METDHDLPMQVWWSSLLHGFFLALFLYLLGYMAALQIWNWSDRSGSWWPVAGRFTAQNWPLLVIGLLVLWIFDTVIIKYRFAIENALKHAPAVLGIWPAELGPWTPWAHKKLFSGQVSLEDVYQALSDEGGKKG
jgi:hypothetical protein